MSAASPSSCSLCHRPLTESDAVCTHCVPEAAADPFAFLEDAAPDPFALPEAPAPDPFAFVENAAPEPMAPVAGDPGLELDWDASPALAARRKETMSSPMGDAVVPLSEGEVALDWTEPPPVAASAAAVTPEAPPAKKATTLSGVPAAAARALPPADVVAVEECSPDARARGMLALGLLALAGSGGVLLVQAALPERFPSLLQMAVRMLAPIGAPSDFFPATTWGLALLPWLLLALGLGVGYRLARRAGALSDLEGLELVAFVLVPGLHLVGGPYVLKMLGAAAESRKAGLRLWLGTRALVAVLLHVGAVALELSAVREPGESQLMVALAARIVSVAAFAAVLSGVGRALGVLVRFVAKPVGKKGLAAHVGGASRPALGWAAMLAATGVAIAGVWFFRSEGRACESGTVLRHLGDAGGQRVFACVLPDGSRQGPEWVRGLDGRLLAHGEYVAGQRHGTFRSWSEKGVLLEERSYAEGKPHGTWTLYQAGGQRLLDEAYADGVLEGPSTLYHSVGNKRLLKHYQKGLAHGRHSTWFDSGLVEEEGAFEEGRRSGWWVKRDRDGKVVKQWSAGLSTSSDTAGVAAVLTAAASLQAPGATEGPTLRSGHTLEWWKERLELLRYKAEKDPASVALYELTLRRARANGFEVIEQPQGVAIALEPTP
ncbi:toxin-antitoxin system YwqK family antitoxin [Archangium lansingense]|uniref:toxin-antitoxin system YwqK family antitoxin n=1 Tax=Archangium lansingense TaxID=2995310 RepID=UPI003B80639B